MSDIVHNCGNCAHMREHEQLGGHGAFCHGKPPDLTLMPANAPVIRGRAAPQGLNMMGLYTPVDKDGGWCRLHEPLAVTRQ